MAHPATQLQEQSKASIASTWSNSSLSSRDSSPFGSPSPVSEHAPQLTRDNITIADDGQPTPFNSPSISKSQEDFPHHTIEPPKDPLIQPPDSFILHQISMLVNDDTLNDFIRRTRHFSNLLSLPLGSYFTEECIRIATWWFLQGRMVLEPLLLEQSSYEDAQHNEALLTQAHLHLWKALWILHETWKNTEGHARINFQNFRGKTQDHLPQVLSQRLELLVKIRQSISAMQRKGLLPKPKDAILAGEPESAILVPYPSLNLDIGYLITGYHTSTSSEPPPLSSIFPLGDTTKEFHYGRMNVDLFLMTGGGDALQTQLRFPAILTMIRGRNEDELSVVLGTQNAIADFSISSSRRHQPTWEHVEWITAEKTLVVKLRTGFHLRLCFNPWDFVTLRKNYQHYTKTKASFRPSQDETLLFELELNSAQYRTSEASDRFFPTTAVKGCRLRLFERRVKRTNSAGSRNVHRGLRVVVITPPSFKASGIVSQEYVPGNVILFGFQNKESIDKLSLRIEDSCPDATLDLNFQQSQEQNIFLQHLTGCYVHNQEQLLMQVPINRFLFSSGLEQSLAQPFSDMHWNNVRVFGQHPSEFQSQLIMPILSESLRVVVDSPKGRITDRINIGIGELKIRRNVISSGHELHVLRESQEDLTMSYNDLEARGNLLDNLSAGLECIQSRQTIRTYSFPNLSDLHIFQMAITGFSVLFDCMVSSFSISRRRRMIPFHKEWSPQHTRLQLLKRGTVVQLVAFFEGFKHGKSMNFALKETDVYHTSAKSNSLKMVDAKFSLPVALEDGMHEEEVGFACLDVIEYPGEHDNIVVSFNSELEFSKFCKALPAPVKSK